MVAWNQAGDPRAALSSGCLILGEPPTQLTVAGSLPGHVETGRAVGTNSPPATRGGPCGRGRGTLSARRRTSCHHHTGSTWCEGRERRSPSCQSALQSHRGFFFTCKSCYWKMSLFIAKSSRDAVTLITPKPSQHKIATH